MPFILCDGLLAGALSLLIPFLRCHQHPTWPPGAGATSLGQDSSLKLPCRLLGPGLWGHISNSCPLCFCFQPESPSWGASGPGPEFGTLPAPKPSRGLQVDGSFPPRPLLCLPSPSPSLPLFASTHIHALNKTFH